MLIKKKKLIISTIILLVVLIALFFGKIEVYRCVSSIDLYSGKICKQSYVCFIPTSKNIMGTSFSDALANYQISAEHTPEWYPDSKVVVRGIGVIKSGGRILNGCEYLIKSIEVSNFDDQKKKACLIKAMEYLQNKDFDKLQGLTEEFLTK